MSRADEETRFIAGLVRHPDWADWVASWPRADHFTVRWHWEMFQAIQARRGDRSAPTSPYHMLNAIGAMYGRLCQHDGGPADLQAAMQSLSDAMMSPPELAEFNCIVAEMRRRADDTDIVDITDVAAEWCKTLDYPTYLLTRHWRVTRAYALARAGHRCQVCNADDEELDVHHRTYERRGEESPDDLIVLCRACHTLFHDNGKLARPRGSGPESC